MLIFSDSFDDRATAQLVQGWTQVITGFSDPTIHATAGRRSTQCLMLQRTFPGAGTEVRVTLNPGDNHVIIGMAYNPASAFSHSVSSDTDSSLFRLRHNGVTQCWAVMGNDGRIRVYQGTNVLRYTSNVVMTQGQYAYVEFDILVHASAGSISVWVNGVRDSTITGINTGANSTWSEFCMGTINGPNGIVWYVDDLYICDGTGARLNAPLGDTRVDATRPNAAGTTSQFTRSTGADQWATIDEALSNADTDYNSSAIADQLDTLHFPTPPLAPTDMVHAVVVKLQARKTDAGASQLQGVTRVSGMDYLSTAIVAPGTTYNVHRFLFPHNPATVLPWTVPDIDMAEFGYKKST